MSNSNGRSPNSLLYITFLLFQVSSEYVETNYWNWCCTYYFVCIISILVINLIKYATIIDEDHILLYINLAPTFLAYVSYFVLIVSLFEFIIAQSPHTMKGILIGFFYVIRFRVAGLLALIKYYALKKLPTCTSAIICSSTVSDIVIIVIALVSFIMYSIVACKYKY